MKKLMLAALAAMLIAPAFVSCAEETTEEKAADAIQDVVKDAKDAAKEVAKDAKEAAKDAKEAAKDAKDAAKDAVKDLTK